MSEHPKDITAQAHQAVAALPADKAYAVGAAVGALLMDGMPIDQATEATIRVADFVARGMTAQKAVDEIIERLKF
jgi:hypothetical protein